MQHVCHKIYNFRSILISIWVLGNCIDKLANFFANSSI